MATSNIIHICAFVPLSPGPLPPANVKQAVQRFAHIIMHTNLLDWQILPWRQTFTKRTSLGAQCYIICELDIALGNRAFCVQPTDYSLIC